MGSADLSLIHIFFDENRRQSVLYILEEMMEHIIWNRKMECADRDEIKELQLARLKETVERCYERVPLYKKKFDKVGLLPKHIKTLSDVRHIPFTTAEDLRETYPLSLIHI